MVFFKILMGRNGLGELGNLIDALDDALIDFSKVTGSCGISLAGEFADLTALLGV